MVICGHLPHHSTQKVRSNLVVALMSHDSIIHENVMGSQLDFPPQFQKRFIHFINYIFNQFFIAFHDNQIDAPFIYLIYF